MVFAFLLLSVYEIFVDIIEKFTLHIFVSYFWWTIFNLLSDEEFKFVRKIVLHTIQKFLFDSSLNSLIYQKLWILRQKGTPSRRSAPSSSASCSTWRQASFSASSPMSCISFICQPGRLSKSPSAWWVRSPTFPLRLFSLSLVKLSSVANACT